MMNLLFVSAWSFGLYCCLQWKNEVEIKVIKKVGDPK
jgi:hypothetical protein